MTNRKMKFFGRLSRAAVKFGEHDGAFLAAGAAYFFGLSIFPLVSALVAGFGLFLRSSGAGQDAHQQLMAVVERNLSPMLAEQIESALTTVQAQSAAGGLFGLAALLIAASAGFVQFQNAFDKIWAAPQASKPGVLGFLWQLVVGRAAAFLMLLGVGTIVLLAFLASTIVATVQARTSGYLPAPGILWTLAQSAASLAVNAAAFTLLYRWLPKQTVPWRHAFQGAAIVALGWEVGRRGLELVLIGTQYTSAYGIVGAFISVLVWCYYGCMLILFGAEFTRECQIAEPSSTHVE